MTETTIFEQIGGRPAVEAIVNDFYRRVEADAPLRAVYPENLAPGRVKLILFLEQWLGGEPRYSDRFGHPRLRRRHFPFVIDEDAAERWLTHMRAAFEAADVGEKEMAIVFERLGPLAHHMVNADEDVPRDPLPEAYLT